MIDYLAESVGEYNLEGLVWLKTFICDVKPHYILKSLKLVDLNHLSIIFQKLLPYGYLIRGNKNVKDSHLKSLQSRRTNNDHGSSRPTIVSACGIRLILRLSFGLHRLSHYNFCAVLFYFKTVIRRMCKLKRMLASSYPPKHQVQPAAVEERQRERDGRKDPHRATNETH